jgi:thymidine kinase
MFLVSIYIKTGSMFSGKSSDLKRYQDRLQIAKRIPGIDFIVYNFAGDTRYGQNILGTHNGDQVPATMIGTSAELFLDLFQINSQGSITFKPNREKLQAIFIDEAQFFDRNLGRTLSFIDSYYLNLRDEHLDIYCAGLDMDFRGEPFPTMADLLARAKTIDKFTAVCSICGEDAPFTQRLIDEKPADYDDPIVLISAKEHYTARCPKHHEVPGKPQPSLK